MTSIDACTRCGAAVRMIESGAGTASGTCPECGHYQCFEMTSRRIPELGPLTGVYVEWPVTEDTGRRIIRSRPVSFARLDAYLGNLRRNGVTDWSFGPMIHEAHRRWSE